MDTPTTVLFIVGLAIVVVGLYGLVMRNRRSDLLKRKFGSEYDRTVRAAGRRFAGEAELESRAKRVAELGIHPLSGEDRDRFADRWRRTQATFVDDPARAVAEADALVDEVMRARGYPAAEFDTRAADISVDHPRLVQNYREAHAIALASRRGTAQTEDLRRATIHFRDLFEDLLTGARA